MQTLRDVQGKKAKKKRGRRNFRRGREEEFRYYIKKRVTEKGFRSYERMRRRSTTKEPREKGSLLSREQKGAGGEPRRKKTH